MVPILFSPTSTEFNTNGLGRLSDANKCIVREELNGEYELEMTYPLTGRLFSSIRHSYIIVARPFRNGVLQAFRIYKISKPMMGTINVYARHISYQLNHIPCSPFSGQSCAQVIGNISDAAVEVCPFTFRTDITGNRTKKSHNLYLDTTVECGKTDLAINPSGLIVYSESVTSIYIKCEPSTTYLIKKMLSNRFRIASFTSVPGFYQEDTYGDNTLVADDQRSVEYVTSSDAEYMLIYLYNEGLDTASEDDILRSFEIRSIGTYTWMLDEPKCIRSFLLGEDDNSIQAIYGGEYEWNNYTVMLWESRGSDNGVRIRYGKNLTDLTQEENIENTITGIYPIWKSSEMFVELPEKVIHSSNWTSYPYARTIIQDFSSDFNDAPSVEELRERALVFMQDENIGVPEVSLEVKFVDLADTMEFSGIGELQTVRLGDTVTVEFPDLRVSAKQKVTKIDYDVLNERYELVTIGTKKNSVVRDLEDELNEISEKVSDDDAQKKVDRATGVLNAGRTGHVIVNRNEDGFANEIYFLDDPNIANAKKVLRINNNGIGFSSEGFRGPYAQAWTLDGHLTLGGVNNANGTLEILDSTGDQIGYWDNHRLHVKGGKIESGQFTSIGNEFYVYEDEETHEVELGWTGWIVEQCTMMSNHMEWQSNNHTNPTSGTSASAAINGGSDSGTYSGSGHEGTASFKALWLDDDWYDGESSNYSYTEEGRRSGHLWDITECLIWLDNRVSALERSGGGGGGGDGSNCGIPSGDSNNCPLPDDSTSCPIIDDSTTCPDNDSSSCGTGDNGSCGGDGSSCSSGGGTCDGPGCGAG